MKIILCSDCSRSGGLINPDAVGLLENVGVMANNEGLSEIDGLCAQVYSGYNVDRDVFRVLVTYDKNEEPPLNYELGVPTWFYRSPFYDVVLNASNGKVVDLYVRPKPETESPDEN